MHCYKEKIFERAPPIYVYLFIYELQTSITEVASIFFLPTNNIAHPNLHTTVFDEQKKGTQMLLLREDSFSSC